MNKMNPTPAFYLLGPTILLSLFLLSGCAGSQSETRYNEKANRYSSPQNGVKSTIGTHDNETAHYVAPKGEKTRTYSSPQSGVKSKIGTYDNATAQYVVAKNENSDTYSNPPSGLKSTIGTHDNATAQYTLRVGGYSPPQYAPREARSDKQAVYRPMVLEVTDVLFEFDKWVIKEPYLPELNQWVDYFQNNPLVTAEIQGHTDSTGPSSYNQNLSAKRAQAVMNYLVREGVDPDRLTAKGFGESQPAASNTTDGGRQKNRRVQVNF